MNDFFSNPELNQSIRLSDGRQLGYSQFGQNGANPVLLMHGTPGSRYFAFPDTIDLDRLGIRIYMPERPGYGLSEPKPDRTITGWCDDIRQFTHTVGIEKFHLLGLSGGGPYALACAQAFPDKVKSVSLVSSVAPLSVAALREGMALSNKLAYLTARYFTPAIRINFFFNQYNLAKHPRFYLQKLYTQLSAWDKHILSDHTKQSVFLQHMNAAFQHGLEGAVSDIKLLLRPWGFELSDIVTKVLLWQGDLDPLIPPEMARYLSEQLPDSQFNLLSGAGHLLFMDRDIMAAILTSVVADEKVENSDNAGREYSLC